MLTIFKKLFFSCVYVRKTDEIWVSRKDIIEDGLGVNNISDLVLKEIHGIYEKKN